MLRARTTRRPDAVPAKDDSGDGGPCPGAGGTRAGGEEPVLVLVGGAGAGGLDRQSATGVGVIREHIFWDRIETSRSVYDWRRLDQLVGDAADRGLRVLPVLLSPPAFYVTRPPGATGAYPPDNPLTMGIFAMKLVQRYARVATSGACRLSERMVTESENVWALAGEHGITLRTAAYAQGLQRISAAIDATGTADTFRS